MTAAIAVARAHAAGLTLVADGNCLRWRGPPPAPDLLADLRTHKAEVLALLAPDAATITPALNPASAEQAADEFAEREAIASEAPLPEVGTPERDQLDRQHAAMVAALLAAAAAKPAWFTEAHPITEHPDRHHDP